jgi:aryl-alcohol dehydrogenase-like predicted oxidoreductase
LQTLQKKSVRSTRIVVSQRERSEVRKERAMEYRQRGNSGLKISALTMGTMTFGGKGNFAKVGNLQLDEVRKPIDIVADAGVNLIDTANVYSSGGSEELIGEAMGHKRQPGMLIASKARFPTGRGLTIAVSPAGTSFANARRA